MSAVRHLGGLDGDKLRGFADRLAALAEAHKADVATVMEEAEKADVDTAALRRLVSWLRLDEVTRAEREAVDQQYRFLAGELVEPATLPEEGELAQAARLYRDGLTVRQVAGMLKVSTGKAHKLKVQAAAFTVHDGVNMNTPPHDPETGEIRDALNLAPDSAPERDMSSASPSDCTGEVTSTCGGANGVRSGEASGSAEPKTAESSCGLSDDKPVSNPAPQDLSDDDPGPIPHFLRRPKQEASV